MKRPIANLYSMSSVLAYETLVEDTVRVMIDQLDKRFASTGQPCDLSSWLQFYAFDVISAATFSSRVGFIDNGEDVGGVMEGIWSRFKYFATIGQMPWLDKFWDKSPLINTLFPAKSSPIAAFAMNLTGKRLGELSASENNEKEATKKSDFLSKFLEIKAKHKDLPDWYLTSWTISNMLAGSDTTAINLRAIFYYLLRHPHSLQRVLDEIKEAEAENRLSEIITYNESKTLKYLDACIKESGRLHPSIGLPLERVVPPGGMEINGHRLPGGTIIGINAWTCQRDYNVFGEDADEWKPERWLVDDARANEMSRAILLVSNSFLILALFSSAETSES
ncbi:uncharacterized protein BHQ10_002034 [Talaromyces amestolkiae]|uniref:Cytochrome P450 n=1 Tax=Talaromyces amestolkiae TaxID=1196081 RepID=A0A364KR41_TALAM|nr:uncharacterized protein BHQ10_002034 [Talaromyces amestolkiae]RAO66022.1 hypothetical protein BHQ10_002034 [Talaromyces amestolkiae]